MNKISNIEFYFPAKKFSTPRGVSKEILDMIKENGSYPYYGFANEKDALENIKNNLGKGSLIEYQGISEKEKIKIEKIISETLQLCNKKLKIPVKQNIFVLPYFPNEEQDVFKGVYGYAVYSCVFYLFINLKTFSKKSLQNTVAHELNHTIYYYNHFEKFGKYSVLDNIILEGLAENFNKSIFQRTLPPWSTALKKSEAFEILNKNQNLLSEVNQQKIDQFIYGSKNFKKWTGYSAGFHLVNEFLKRNPNLGWKNIMKVSPDEFLKVLHH
jgi:uncharacterized protein YjaZ